MIVTRKLFGFLFALWLIADAHAANAQQPKIWLALPNSNKDFGRLFTDPGTWAHAAKAASVYSLSGNYFRSMPASDVKRAIATLQAAGLQLDVGLPALPVDKHVCGGKTEGMIWPGEIGLYVKSLTSMNVPVSSFSFDLPLTDGHISRSPDACHLSVLETAKRLATTMRELRTAYPNAKFIDIEVPTGIPAAQWTAILNEWLSDIQQESGEQFSGLLMDMWWEFKWEGTYQQSVQILHSHGVQAGSFIDADGGHGVNALGWIGMAKQHACAVLSLARPDFVVVANWLRPGTSHSCPKPIRHH